jgi:hypothetical protein
MATGRRFIEVVKLGRFKKTGDFTLEFSGQAKKRGGVDYSETYEIYTAVDAQLCIDAFEQLRSLPEISSLDQYDKLGHVKSTDAINKRCAKTANEAAKKTFGRDSAVFKDSRAMWARIVFERNFKSDPKWAKKDEDVFWQEMLGHDDMETQKSYKGFKINYDDIDVDDSDEPPVTRSEAIQALDKLDAIQHRKAMLKLHEWVKEALANDPHAKITQSLITRTLGSSRLVISDYMKLAGDALKLPACITELPEITKPKPHIHCTRISDSRWQAVITIGGEEVVNIENDGSRVDAMKAAFSAINE